MRGLHGAALVLLGLLGVSAAHAENREMQCPVLSIGSFDWSRSPCVVQEQDNTLYLNWQGESGREHWLRLDLSDRGYMADAAWNGITAEASAADDLGKLIRSGDCWFGNAARFCLAPAEQAATREGAAAGDQTDAGGVSPDPDNAPVGREAELDAYYPCAAHRSLEDKERLNDYANATKTDPCTVTASRQELDALADRLEIAQEVEGDEEEAERATAGEAGEQSAGGETMAQTGGGGFANASSFRGLQLGMTPSQVVAALPQPMILAAERAGGDVLQELTGFAEQFTPGARPRIKGFIVNNQSTCGEVTFVDAQVDRLRLYQCFFNIPPGMTIEDFVQQVIDNYRIEDGMSGRWEMLGDGPYRFKYTEYVGVRRETSERFTASLHEMNGVLTLTVERIPSVNFN